MLRQDRLLRAMFVTVPLLGVAGLALPPALYLATGPFPQKTAGTILFLILCLEKFWAMYFRMGNRCILVPERDWTSVSVGMAHTLIMYGAIFEFYLRQTGFRFAWATAVGGAVHAAALALRYGAFRELRHQWAVHVDKRIEGRELVRTGPYRWVRHPLYLAACMEIAGIPLMLNAFWTTVIGLAVFVPVELSRIRFEEQCLREVFGGQYAAYEREVGALIPRFRGKA